jgi:iron transport multicopper oxidase
MFKLGGSLEHGCRHVRPDPAQSQSKFVDPLDNSNFSSKSYVSSDITSSITYNPSRSVPLQDLGTIEAYHDVNDTALVPIPAIAQPIATKTISLEVQFATMDDGTNRAMFNGITYNSPLVPAVFSELTLAENATVASAYGPLSFVVEDGDIVDLVVKNGDAGKHPL